jgi:hypothetical protein
MASCMAGQWGLFPSSLLLHAAHAINPGGNDRGQEQASISARTPFATARASAARSPLWPRRVCKLLYKLEPYALHSPTAHRLLAQSNNDWDEPHSGLCPSSFANGIQESSVPRQTAMINTQ